MMRTSIQYCIIATTVRSGSTWLCDVLENNGLGHPTEHFNPSIEAGTFGKAIAKGTPTEKYLGQLIEYGANNGLFITKLLSEWLPLMRAQMGEYTPDEAHLLTELFPSAKYIFLIREDIIATAISSCLAEQTGKWNQVLNEAEVQYSSIEVPPESIHANVLWLKMCQFKWVELFRIMGINPLFITYETLYSKPEETLKKIGSFLGSTSRMQYALDTKYTRQSKSYPTKFREEYESLINR